MVLSRTAVVGSRVAVVLAWSCALGYVLSQILYSKTEPGGRVPLTVLTVLFFAAASVVDAAVRGGPRAAVGLLVFAGGGGLLAEVVGVHTGLPFGEYAYSGDLGWSVLGVPAVVPLAWVMMAWPALLVGRALGVGRWAVVVGAWALASWDVFLDPQMVDAGYWSWSDPEPALPGVSGVPVSNFAGWLVVAVVIVACLHAWVPRDRGDPSDVAAGPAPALYVWTYVSSVWAHAAFFDRPWVSLVGGLLMGLVALPYAWVVVRSARARWGR
ncbi:carotenoid biosynthesis protein [Actinokineospora sp. NBRC 105648]|uniref:carotenoid biosynthesis protein n=1 Tax=Actinokineospora sp. NBRC 105648 TaxID=3032206 RepID=UPI0024A41C25|nr:carotenoid biosynthesis protein [Actinokineospora sp. NBRC 105648]GLZ40542.1 membrane protein [Actinokineospora sp. NBRC 105648]